MSKIINATFCGATPWQDRPEGSFLAVWRHSNNLVIGRNVNHVIERAFIGVFRGKMYNGMSTLHQPHQGWHPFWAWWRNHSFHWRRRQAFAWQGLGLLSSRHCVRRRMLHRLGQSLGGRHDRHRQSQWLQDFRDASRASDNGATANCSSSPTGCGGATSNSARALLKLKPAKAGSCSFLGSTRTAKIRFMAWARCCWTRMITSRFC